MEIEATQALDFAEYGDETDDEEAAGKNLVAHLKVSMNNGANGSTHDVFEGSTLIGRDSDACAISLPACKSLSKQHACIEVTDGMHLICDLGSRNKTRRDKLFLRPHVRYELKHGDALTFGDVRCTYLIVQSAKLEQSATSPMVSGSSTVVLSEADKPVVTTVESTVKADYRFFDSDSDASSDILQPIELDESLIVGGRPPNANLLNNSTARDSLKVVDDSTLMDRVPYSDCETDSDNDIEQSPDRSVIEETQTFDVLPAFKTASVVAETQTFDAIPTSSSASLPTHQIQAIDDTATHVNGFEGTVACSSDNSSMPRDSQTAPTQVFEMADLPSQDLPTQTYPDEAEFDSCSSRNKAGNDFSISQTAATQVVDVSKQFDELQGSMSSSIGATQVFDTKVAASRESVSDSPSDFTATQVFEIVPVKLRASQLSQPPNHPHDDDDDDATQKIDSTEGETGKGKDIVVANEKRLTFSPHSSSTQASEPETSVLHLELDLSEYNESSRGRSSLTAPAISPKVHTDKGVESTNSVPTTPVEGSKLVSRCSDSSTAFQPATCKGNETSKPSEASMVRSQSHASNTRLTAVPRELESPHVHDDGDDKELPGIGTSICSAGPSEALAVSSDFTSVKDSSVCKASHRVPKTVGAQLISLNEFSRTIAKDKDAVEQCDTDNINELKADVFDIFSMDPDEDVKDLPTQQCESDSFVLPKKPNRQTKNAGTKKLSVGRKGRNCMQLIRLDEIQPSETSPSKAKNELGEAATFDVYSMQFDEDLNNSPTQAFEGADCHSVRSRPSAVKKDKSLGQGRKRKQLPVKVDELETQTFDTSESTVEPVKKGGKSTINKNIDELQTQTFDTQCTVEPAKRASKLRRQSKVPESCVSSMAVVEGSPEGCHETSSLSKTSDASRLLDILSTQAFDNDHMPTAVAVSGLDIMSTQAFDKSPKIIDEHIGKVNRRLKKHMNDEKAIAMVTKQTAEQEDIGLSSDEGKKSVETDASFEPRRLSSRMNKGKHPLKVVESCSRSVMTKMKESTLGEEKASVADVVSGKQVENMSSSKGQRKRKLMPLDLLVLEDSAEAEPISKLVPNNDASKTSIEPVRSRRGQAKAIQVKEDVVEKEVLVAEVMQASKFVEAVPSSQMSDDSELPALAAFTTISSKNSKAIESFLTDNLAVKADNPPVKVDSKPKVVKRVGRASVLKESQLECNDESQELPIVANDPEDFRHRLSLLCDSSKRQKVLSKNVAEPLLSSMTSSAEVEDDVRTVKKGGRTKSLMIVKKATPSSEEKICETAEYTGSPVAVAPPLTRQTGAKRQTVPSTPDKQEAAKLLQSPATSARASLSAEDENCVTTNKKGARSKSLMIVKKVASSSEEKLCETAENTSSPVAVALPRARQTGARHQTALSLLDKQEAAKLLQSPETSASASSSAEDENCVTTNKKGARSKSLMIVKKVASSREEKICDTVRSTDSLSSAVADVPPQIKETGGKRLRSKPLKTDTGYDSDSVNVGSSTAVVTSEVKVLNEEQDKPVNKRRRQQPFDDGIEKTCNSPSVILAARGSTPASLPDAGENPLKVGRQRGKTANKSVDASPTMTAVVVIKPKVMFTGVVDESGEKLVKSLGGDIAESIYECTHLVTDQVRRTVKFLCGVARGILIVTPDWLARCKDWARSSNVALSSSSHFNGTSWLADAEEFIIRDVANEKKFLFSLAASLKMAVSTPVLSTYKVHVTAGVKPEPSQMKDIIQCAGGKYLPNLPRKFEESVVVVSCDENAAQCKPVVDCGIPVVSAEFLLTGILRQKVDFETFRLLSASVSVTPSRAGKTKSLKRK